MLRRIKVNVVTAGCRLRMSRCTCSNCMATTWSRQLSQLRAITEHVYGSNQPRRLRYKALRRRSTEFFHFSSADAADSCSSGLLNIRQFGCWYVVKRGQKYKVLHLQCDKCLSLVLEGSKATTALNTCLLLQCLRKPQKLFRTMSCCCSADYF
jgi:hypothetical protein